MMKNSFFDEITDNPKYERFSVYGLGAIIFISILWVLVAIPEYQNNAIIYLFMLVIWIFGLTSDLIWQTLGLPNQAAVNGVGKKPIPAFLIGLALGLVLIFVASTFSIIPFSFIGATTLNFFFVVIAAPFVEANFFRGTVQPTFTLLIQDWITTNTFIAGCISMLVTSFAFALYHVNVIGSGESYVPYFIFGIISTILVYATKSIASEWGLHGINNLFAYLSR